MSLEVGTGEHMRVYSKQRINVLSKIAPIGTDVHNRHLTRLLTIDWVKNGGQLKLCTESLVWQVIMIVYCLLGHA